MATTQLGGRPGSHEELIGMSVFGKTSAQVLKLVKKYDEQIKFISSKAQELAHVDKALAEVDTGVAKMKASWPHGQPARNLYKSDLYKEYNEERKMMTAEKSLIEGSLQRYSFIQSLVMTGAVRSIDV